MEVGKKSYTKNIKWDLIDQRVQMSSTHCEIWRFQLRGPTPTAFRQACLGFSAGPTCAQALCFNVLVLLPKSHLRETASHPPMWAPDRLPPFAMWRVLQKCPKLVPRYVCFFMTAWQFVSFRLSRENKGSWVKLISEPFYLFLSLPQWESGINCYQYKWEFTVIEVDCSISLVVEKWSSAVYSFLGHSLTYSGLVSSSPD